MWLFPAKEVLFLSYFLCVSMTDFLFSHIGESCSFSVDSVESLEENFDEAGA